MQTHKSFCRRVHPVRPAASKADLTILFSWDSSAMARLVQKYICASSKKAASSFSNRDFFENLVSANDLLLLLNISSMTLWRLQRAGLPVHRIAGRRRFNLAEVRVYIANPQRAKFNSTINA